MASLPSTPATPYKVLIVDDDELSAAILEHHLPEDRFSLQRALKGEDALNLMQENDFDVVLLDVKMPGISGFDVLKQMRSSQHTQHTAVIMLSGMDSEEDVIRSFELGANDYVTKPFGPAVLRARIARHAATASALKQ